MNRKVIFIEYSKREILRNPKRRIGINANNYNKLNKPKKKETVSIISQTDEYNLQ